MKNLKFETERINKLLEAMNKQGAPLEQFSKVLTYLEEATKVDNSYVSLLEMYDAYGIRRLWDIYIGDEKKKKTDIEDDLIPVTRNQTCLTDWNDIYVGDKLNVNLEGFGWFTVTCHLETSQNLLFIFDECIAEKSIDGLYEWLNTEVLNAFSDNIRKKISFIHLPEVCQIFGRDNAFCNRAFEYGYNTQLPLMKYALYKRTTFNDKDIWYWLRNKTKPNCIEDGYAGVDFWGDPCYGTHSNIGGVRPEFIVKK